MRTDNGCTSYRDLQIYQEAHQLGVDIHFFSLRLPKMEMFETGSQLRRSSKSISVNIVEGYGRRYYKADFVKFLIYAHASCDETIEWLEYLCKCHPTLAIEAKELQERAQELSRRIHRFTRGVMNKHRSIKELT